MAALPGLRTLLRLHRPVTLQHSFRLIPVQLTPPCLSRRLCSPSTECKESMLLVNPENISLIDNLNLMGVDVRKARQRQPGVFRKTFTNEQGLAQFLKGKGASLKTIASIISRYPRCITRSIEHLEQRWELWGNIFKTDAEIMSVMDRSPESFFRSSDNGNLEKNIVFLSSLGLTNKDLHRLLTTAPRTFSNSFELNKQMVELLKDICAKLSGENPEQFSKTVISRNLYILIRSSKRVKTNVDILRASLTLSDSELLDLLEGPGAEILDLSSKCLKNHFSSLQQKMVSLGCDSVDISKLIFRYPAVLYFGSTTLNSKLDCLIKGGITMEQILEKARVLDYSTQNITKRLEKLQKLGYDFQKNGISILDTSQKRFEAKIEKITASLAL